MVRGDCLQIQKPDGLLVTPEESNLTTLEPGSVVTHTIQLTNASLITDSYKIEITSNWPAELPFTNSPDLGPGESLDIPIKITTPMQYGASDTALLKINAKINSSYTTEVKLNISIVPFKVYLPLILR